MPLIPRLNIHVEAGVGIPTLFFPDDRSFQGIWSHPDVPDIVFSDSSISGPAVFRGGAIGTGAPVQLVYWGSFWKTPEGRAREQFLTDGMRRMIDSVYWSGLAQYGINPPTYRGSMIVTRPEAPMRFKDGTMKPVLDLVDDLIGDERVPDPDDERIAFIVFMPRYFANPPSGDLGAHSSDLKYDFPFDTDRYWAAWVGYYAFDLDGTPRDRDPEDTLMIASHELVGILTSPERDGWTIGPKEEHIPDAAILLPGGVEQVANVNGVRVNAYWSNAHNATIIPIDRDYAGQLVGTVVATNQHLHATGTFRPDRTDRLCDRNPACCIEDRDYSWTVIGIDETATLRVETKRYRTPGTTSWRVGDQTAPNGSSGTLNVTVKATEFRGREAVTVARSVPIRYVQRGNTLTLSTSNAGCNFDVNVQCEVRDLSFQGSIRTNVVAKPNVTVGFVGQRLELDPAYRARWEACLKALTAEYKRNYTRERQLPGDDDDGLLTINTGVLNELPAWTRVLQYERSARAADLERMARAILPRDAADELTAAVLADSPELAMAVESMANGPG